MKLNRSAIILAIAIVLLIVALFVVRNSNEGNESEFLTNASNATDISGNATNATMATANATMATTNATMAIANATMPADNATMPTDNATAFNATSEAQSNATANATAEKEKLAKEKAEKAAKEKATKEKAAKDKAAKEKAAKEKAEQEKKDKSNSVATAPTTPATPKATKPGAKPSKGSPPSEAVISQLNDFGSRRVSLINSSIRPNKSSREVSKQGKEYVARYYYVSPSSLRTEATPADSSAPFIYVGKVRYQECLYECRASSKEEAMRGEGQLIQSRNMLELIRYTNKWTE